MLQDKVTLQANPKGLTIIVSSTQFSHEANLKDEDEVISMAWGEIYFGLACIGVHCISTILPWHQFPYLDSFIKLPCLDSDRISLYLNSIGRWFIIIYRDSAQLTSNQKIVESRICTQEFSTSS